MGTVHSLLINFTAIHDFVLETGLGACAWLPITFMQQLITVMPTSISSLFPVTHLHAILPAAMIIIVLSI